MIKFENETRVVIYSSRFAETRYFYEQILGLPVVKEWNHGTGKLGVVYLLGGVYLEFLEGVTQLPCDDFYLYFKVGSIDALWNELSQKAIVPDEIQTTSWHHRNFSIRDPNGYRLKFFTEVS